MPLTIAASRRKLRPGARLKGSPSDRTRHLVHPGTAPGCGSARNTPLPALHCPGTARCIPKHSPILSPERSGWAAPPDLAAPPDRAGQPDRPARRDRDHLWGLAAPPALDRPAGLCRNRTGQPAMPMSPPNALHAFSDSPKVPVNRTVPPAQYHKIKPASIVQGRAQPRRCDQPQLPASPPGCDRQHRAWSADCPRCR